MINATLTDPDDVSDVALGSAILGRITNVDDKIAITFVKPSVDDADYEVHFELSKTGDGDWILSDKITQADDPVNPQHIARILHYRFRLVSLSAGTIDVGIAG